MQSHVKPSSESSGIQVPPFSHGLKTQEEFAGRVVSENMLRDKPIKIG